MKVITKTYRWENSLGYTRDFSIRIRKVRDNYIVESFVRIPMPKFYDGVNYLEAHPRVLYRGPNKSDAEAVAMAQKDESYHTIIKHGKPQLVIT